MYVNIAVNTEKWKSKLNDSFKRVSGWCKLISNLTEGSQGVAIMN